MRIVIDLRIFGPSFGGLGRYNQKFLENLIKQDQANEYVLLFRSQPKDLVLPKNFSIKICPCRWYSLAEQIVLPFILYPLKPDLVHFPHFNVPIFYNGPFVVTIHDLIMTKFPSKRATTLSRHYFAFKYWFYKQVIRHAVKNSEKIIAVSNFTAQDIKQHFHLSDTEAKKIQVVYEGLSVSTVSNHKPVSVPDKFLLYVGNAYPHKNLEFLIRSFKEFFDKHRGYYLILIGEKNYFYNRLKEESKEIFDHDRDQVIFPGFVPDEELRVYYQRARAYVFPSLYEGFGLPPLEAMFYNLPVLSSSAGSLPEVLGEAALYFNPKDKQDFLDKLEQIVTDQELRERLVRSGQEQIKKYSWEKMTKEILTIYGGK